MFPERLKNVILIACEKTKEGEKSLENKYQSIQSKKHGSDVVKIKASH